MAELPSAPAKANAQQFGRKAKARCACKVQDAEQDKARGVLPAPRGSGGRSCFFSKSNDYKQMGMCQGKRDPPKLSRTTQLRPRAWGCSSPASTSSPTRHRDSLVLGVRPNQQLQQLSLWFLSVWHLCSEFLTAAEGAGWLQVSPLWKPKRECCREFATANC